MKKDDPSRRNPAPPRPPHGRPRDEDPGDASDPDRPIPRDPGKETDIEIDDKGASREPPGR